ncbi:hypothetical protein [Methylobacterium soli]|uniref:Uncharacterized protein n=1 Tax=Methylobacterium soli TaxID=553447 RepID=A0A6L3T3L2_9HYPH|nr:hypothetical protein [Methylobacterium soli]KAB1081427.1 hypothetical protein F6X53_03740 [Methylobacterium soli]GJE43967.1 hypothetical protein AEGHOMDF_3153 [Methylobacterium soli]
MSGRIACAECGNVLTETERHYYERRCEQCERDWCDRIEAWRHGSEDAELDGFYDGPPPPTKQ